MEKKFSQITANLFDLLVILNKKIFNPLVLSKVINLTPGQFSILFYLMKNNNSSVSEAADYLQISKPNMTPLLDSLIDLGYVERTRDTKDRRVVRLSLTEAGLDFYNLMKKTNIGFVKEIFKDFGEDELKELLEFSDKLLEVMSKASGLEDLDHLSFAEQALTGKEPRKKD